MSVLYIALPVTLALVAAAVVAFVVCVRRGQFSDLETPGMRVLFDDDEVGGRPRDGDGEASSVDRAG